MLNKRGLHTIFYFSFLYLVDLKTSAPYGRCRSPLIQCYNGGECRIELGTGQPYCQCSEHFMGPTCEISTNTTRCESLSCSAKESCVFTRDQNRWMCLCDVSKYGSECYMSSPGGRKTSSLEANTQGPEIISTSHIGIYIIVGSLVFTAIVVKIGLLHYHIRVKRRRPVSKIPATQGGGSLYIIGNQDVPLSSILAKAPSYEEACSNRDSPPSYEEISRP